MNRTLFLTTAAAGVALVALQATAALVVDLGEITLLEDTPGQEVALTVSGGDAVSGLSLLVVVGDGGPELQAIDPARSGLDGPAITDVDVLDGTIFSGVSTDITPPTEPQFPQFQQRSVLVDQPPGSVVAEGVFARVTFDTTGFAAGETFPLSLDDVLFTSQFFDPLSATGQAVPLTLVGGTLRLVVVPEPAAFGGLAAVAGLFLARRRSR